jgi:hypothetical protein
VNDYRWGVDFPPVLPYHYKVIEIKHMWDEIMDMPGEIFDLDIDDRDMMPLDMQDDIENEDPLLD